MFLRISCFDCYTDYFILKVAQKYFFTKTFSEKMFQTKIVWVEGGHKRVLI